MSDVTVRKRLPAWARWVVGIVVVAVALNMLIAVLNSIYATPGGPRSSSYSTGPGGIAAYAELLAVHGYRVVPQRGELIDGMPPGGTLVVLDPQTLTTEEASALERWVSAGGRLVIGGRPEWWSGALLSTGVEWSAGGVTQAGSLVEVAETAGVTSVAADGFGSWTDPAGALPLLGDETTTIAAVAEVGAGRAVLLADTSLVHNRNLASEDNAIFALDIAGPPGTTVVFAEGIHGYGDATGLRAIPLRWKVALAGLVLAALVWMVAVGRRLGPPQPEGRRLPPPRGAYLDALATTLARTKQRTGAIAPVREAGRTAILHRSGIEDPADRSAVEGAARALGLNETEIAALLGDGAGDEDVINAGRALVRLGRRRW